MITKNYIKQCEQAEELQAWYKSDVKNVHEGDRYICQCDTCKESMYVHIVKDSDIDYINNRDMTDVDPTYAAMVSLSGIGEFGAFWDSGGFIYLPTQERLQEILHNYCQNNKVNWIECGESISKKVILRFSDFVIDTLYYFGYDFNSLWLAYIMDEIYHKIWTGEKWVKAND